MKHFVLTFLMFVGICFGAWGQRLVISGTAKEAKTLHPVEFASVALLRADSTAVKVGSTDEKGAFILSVPEKGNYIVKLSYVGFNTLFRSVKMTEEQDSVSLGDLMIEANDNVLNTATVSVSAARIEQKGDTTQFNAAAYRVPEGSTLEALVKQLPGVEVSDDGTIKWNGKTVNEFLVNGKDFFKGDTKIAMKNLPTEMINQIKAYQKQSEYTEQTGIDDGEETTVLDIYTKTKLKNSWFTNLDVAYGNHDRYSANLFTNRFTDRTRVSAFGSMNNTNNKSYGGGYGRNAGGGLVAEKKAGMDFNWENDKKKKEAGKLEIGGAVNYEHMNSDALTSSNSETFLSAGKSSSFGNSWRNHGNKRTNFNSDFRIKWSPDSLTQITFRPSYSYSESSNTSSSLSATFSENPFDIDGILNPLDSIFAQNVMENNPELYAIMVNTNRRLSTGNTKNHNVNGNLNVTRRLNAKGRNISLKLRGGYSTTESENFSISHISYNPQSMRDPRFLNQYSTTPSKRYNYSVRLGYAEPFTQNWIGELRYQYSYKYTDSDRSRFNLDSLAYEPYASMFPEFAAYGDPDNFPALGSLPNKDGVLNYIRDLNNSQYATYKYYNHSVNAGIRYKSKTIRFNAGVNLNPEKTKMAYNRPGQHIDTLITRNTFKVSPQARFRYKFSSTRNLDISYSGQSSQPSMTDLLAIVDDSNPLNISMGNPGLKPSWNNSFNLDYNDYNVEKQLGIATNVSFDHHTNSIANRMIYDETTGVRYTRPENIDGNWNGRAMFMLSSALGKKKLFSLNTFTHFTYDNAVGYVSRFDSKLPSPQPGSRYLMPLPETPHTSFQKSDSYDFYNRLFEQADAQKNTTRTFTVSQSMRAAYRNSWYDIGAIGRVKYQHARASVRENANMDTWNFAYGANANFNFNFGLSISTDIRMSSRRGYSDASMNTNELLWNAQIAYSFLKHRAATLSFQIFDILQQKSNISRQLSATQRVDNWNNSIESFFMVHFIYKLNLINGKRGAKSEEKYKYGKGKHGGYGGSYHGYKNYHPSSFKRGH